MLPFSGNYSTKFQPAIGLNANLTSVGSIITVVVPLVLAAAGLFLLFYLVTGGFGIMTSKGDPKALDAARTKITTAIVGFIIIFVAYWIVQLLGLILGVTQVQNTFR